MAGVRFPAGASFFSSPKRPDQLRVPPSLLSKGYLSPRVKRQRHEADQSPPSSAEVENDEAIPPLHHTSSWRDTKQEQLYFTLHFSGVHIKFWQFNWDL
jgi:hypothetical protein